MPRQMTPREDTMQSTLAFAPTDEDLAADFFDLPILAYTPALPVPETPPLRQPNAEDDPMPQMG